ncbi:MAG: hypothetical protein K2J39_12950, partial [Ruminococcus sp.]|nr:hypothetical protein [Ruminococcus sp.]
MMLYCDESITEANNRIKQNAFNFISEFGSNIRAKFDNVCGKTGQYDVPDELFQKRTSRKNRVLISWKTVRDNFLTLEQLETFEGGVVVEFVNEDYFYEANWQNPVFCELANRIGGNDTVSAMISIRSEDGSSSSQLQRKYFEILTRGTWINYNGENIYITLDNYQYYAIKRSEQIKYTGVGNDKWDGFLFVSIKGGQQDTIETHKGKEEKLFNPACEYANEDVCTDINLVVAYFALMSICDESLNNLSNKLNCDYISIKTMYAEIINDVKLALQSSYYNPCRFFNGNYYYEYSGNLLDYVEKHPCVNISPGELYDPIQIESIHIE